LPNYSGGKYSGKDEPMPGCDILLTMVSMAQFFYIPETVYFTAYKSASKNDYGASGVERQPNQRIFDFLSCQLHVYQGFCKYAESDKESSR